jgi:hypothetical protein
VAIARAPMIERLVRAVVMVFFSWLSLRQLRG